MKSAHTLIASTLLGLFSATALAVPTVYTSSASFLAQVAAGAYTESFDGLAQLPTGPILFSGGAWSFSLSAVNEVYASGAFVGTSLPGDALTINFSGGNVKAIGANFFASDLGDNFQSAQITLTLSDGSVTNFTPSSLGDSYRGFISAVAISSLTISDPGSSLYANLDNLTIGAVAAPIPEPASLVLMGLGLAGLAAMRRRSI